MSPESGGSPPALLVVNQSVLLLPQLVVGTHNVVAFSLS